jgi:hypothetical protein
VFKAFRGSRAIKEFLELMVLLDHKGQEDYKVLGEEQLAGLDRPVKLVKLVRLDQLGHKDCPE